MGNPTHKLPFAKVNLPVLVLVCLVHKLHEVADNRSVNLLHFYIIPCTSVEKIYAYAQSRSHLWHTPLREELPLL
jgi:hypothetical protein